ncbi:hypothetical protein [Desulfosporosinus fructosivorans]
MNNTVPLFEFEKLFYFREEKEDYVSFVAPNTNSIEPIRINSSAYQILKLCNGKNKLHEILNTLYSLYSKVSQDMLGFIEGDLIETLHEFTKMNIIKWPKGGNPFMKKYTFGDDYEIFMVTEDDFNDLYNFIINNIEQNGIFDITYKNPTFNINEFDQLDLRNMLFNMFEDYFILKQNNKIIGLVSISCNFSQSKSEINLVVGDLKSINYLMDYIFKNYKEITFKDPSKIKFLFNSIEKNNLEKLLNLIKKYKFEFEAILKKEINKNDIEIYSLFLD